VLCLVSHIQKNCLIFLLLIFQFRDLLTLKLYLVWFIFQREKKICIHILIYRNVKCIQGLQILKHLPEVLRFVVDILHAEYFCDTQESKCKIVRHDCTVQGLSSERTDKLEIVIPKVMGVCSLQIQ
jgi:hypothetical protein